MGKIHWTIEAFEKAAINPLEKFLKEEYEQIRTASSKRNKKLLRETYETTNEV